MSWWPGWSSVADADWWSNFYFWLGIGALLLLGASEVVAHRYSLRKDELVAIAEQDTKSKRDAEAARLNEELAAAKAAREPRRLLPAEQEKLREALRPIPRFRVVISAGTAGGDERAYADGIAAAMNGWDVTVNNAIFMGPQVTGVWLQIRGGQGDPIPPAVVAFRDALAAAGVDIRHDDAVFQGVNTIPEGEVVLCVGMRQQN